MNQSIDDDFSSDDFDENKAIVIHTDRSKSFFDMVPLK